MRIKLILAALAGASLATSPVLAKSPAAPVSSNPAASLSLADVGKVRTSSVRGKSRKLTGSAVAIAVIAAAAIGVGAYLAVDGSTNDPVSR